MLCLFPWKKGRKKELIVTPTPWKYGVVFTQKRDSGYSRHGEMWHNLCAASIAQTQRWNNHQAPMYQLPFSCAVQTVQHVCHGKKFNVKKNGRGINNISIWVSHTNAHRTCSLDVKSSSELKMSWRLGQLHVTPTPIPQWSLCLPPQKGSKHSFGVTFDVIRGSHCVDHEAGAIRSMVKTKQAEKETRASTYL